MEFPSLNTYLNPPYPFIVPVPRGLPFTDKDGKPTIPAGSVPPTIPYGVPYFPPPPGQPGPPPPPNTQGGPGGALFPGHPYPLIGNYLPPQYHRFYQDAHFLYFPPDMKLPSKFPPMKFPIDQLAMMPRDNRLVADKKMKKKPREVKEEREPKREKPKKMKKKANYCICEQPEDGKFMVGCDVCDNWFHPKCVNISKKVAKTLDYFVCPHCKDFVPEEDRLQALQALEHQQPKKKPRKDSSPSKEEEEGSIDFLEQLSHAALQALENSDKEEKKSKGHAKERHLDETERPAKVTFKSLELQATAKIELSRESIFSVKETQTLLEHLIASTPWEQEQIQVYGTTYNEPRLTAWYGDTYCNYVNHGVTRHVLPWTEELLMVKARVEEICQCTFNNMLLNYYRSGEDYMIFHDELVVRASKDTIASVSVGSERNFIVKNRNTDEVHTIKIHNGSLLTLVGEETAKHYIYSVPKARSSTGPRINIMLRNVERDTSAPAESTTENGETSPEIPAQTQPDSMAIEGLSEDNTSSMVPPEAPSSETVDAMLAPAAESVTVESEAPAL